MQSRVDISDKFKSAVEDTIDVMLGGRGVALHRVTDDSTPELLQNIASLYPTEANEARAMFTMMAKHLTHAFEVAEDAALYAQNTREEGTIHTHALITMGIIGAYWNWCLVSADVRRHHYPNRLNRADEFAQRFSLLEGLSRNVEQAVASFKKVVQNLAGLPDTIALLDAFGRIADEGSNDEEA